MIMKSFRPFRVVQFQSSEGWRGSKYLSGSDDNSYRVSRALGDGHGVPFPRYTSCTILRGGRFAYLSSTNHIRQGGPYSVAEIARSEDGGAHRQFKWWSISSSDPWPGSALNKLL